jgi:hypothetical protein
MLARDLTSYETPYGDGTASAQSLTALASVVG